MNRLSFIAALFGFGCAAKAQQWRQCVPAKGYDLGFGAILCSDKNKPALNNQCPVCGEMAPPVGKQFKVLAVADCTKQTFGYQVRPGGEDLYQLRTCREPYVGSEILVRCKRCNAAFFQDPTI